MPAAAVIPAPRAYIKVVAVKKLVVGPWGDARFKLRGVAAFGSRFRGGARSSRFCVAKRRRRASLVGGEIVFRRVAPFFVGLQDFTLNKLERSKQAKSS